MGQYDILWKGMLEEVFEDLMRFIFPDIDKELDLKRGVTFLDKELGKLFPEPDKPAQIREVDKLVKVYRMDGTEKWILLHLEIQGWNDPKFARRMFQYYYRILDRYGRPVTALVIFTGRDRKYMPDRFEEEFLGTKIIYQYNTLCAFDYTDEELIASDNPFASAILVTKLIAIRAISDDRVFDLVLLKQKVLLTKLLFAKSYSEHKINAIMAFLNNYVVFKNPETYRIFKERVDKITGKKNTMGILEQIAEIKAAEALEKGRAEGEELANRRFVEYLLTNTDFSLDKIASEANVSLDFVNRIKEGIRTK